MFGYITVHKDELKIKDYDRYRAYYCGVCHSLRHKYGITGMATLSYDMTFLAVFLSSLYEDETAPVRERCIVHPVKSHNAIYNEYTDYAAAMNVLLTYYKLQDDWDDERKVTSEAFAKILRGAYKKAAADYPEQEKIIRNYIQEQHACEHRDNITIDDAATPTAGMLAALFDYGHDMWREPARKMGFYMGKYIYIMDAFEDVYKDEKKDCFNPLIPYKDCENFNEQCRQMLVMMAAECAKAFEALPILDNADILRNIIYSGIWTGYNRVCETRSKDKDGDRK